MTINRLLLLAILLVASTTAEAQRFNKKSVYDDLRHGQWEASLLVQGAGGVDLGGESGSSIEVDDTIHRGQALSQHPRVGVVIGQPFHHIIQRHDTGGGDNPGLAEYPA